MLSTQHSNGIWRQNSETPQTCGCALCRSCLMPDAVGGAGPPATWRPSSRPVKRQEGGRHSRHRRNLHHRISAGPMTADSGVCVVRYFSAARAGRKHHQRGRVLRCRCAHDGSCALLRQRWCVSRLHTTRRRFLSPPPSPRRAGPWQGQGAVAHTPLGRPLIVAHVAFCEAWATSTKIFFSSIRATTARLNGVSPPLALPWALPA